MAQAALPAELLTSVLVWLVQAHVGDETNDVLVNLLAVAAVSKATRAVALQSSVWYTILCSDWDYTDHLHAKGDAMQEYRRLKIKDDAIAQLVERIALTTHARLPLYEELEALVDAGALHPFEGLAELEYLAGEQDPGPWPMSRAELSGEAAGPSVSGMGTDRNGRPRKAGDPFLARSEVAMTAFRRVKQRRALGVWQRAITVPALASLYDDSYDEWMTQLEEMTFAFSAWSVDRTSAFAVTSALYTNFTSALDRLMKGALADEHVDFDHLSDDEDAGPSERLRTALRITHKALRTIGTSWGSKHGSVFSGQSLDERTYVWTPPDDEDCDHESFANRPLSPMLFNLLFAFLARRLPPALRFRCALLKSVDDLIGISMHKGGKTFYYPPARDDGKRPALFLTEAEATVRGQVTVALGEVEVIQRAYNDLQPMAFWLDAYATQLVCLYQGPARLGVVGGNAYDDLYSHAGAPVARALACLSPHPFHRQSNNRLHLKRFLDCVTEVDNRAERAPETLLFVVEELLAAFDRYPQRASVGGRHQASSRGERELGQRVTAARKADLLPPKPTHRSATISPIRKVGDLFELDRGLYGVYTGWKVEEGGKIVYRATVIEPMVSTSLCDMTQQADRQPPATLEESASSEDVADLLDSLPRELGKLFSHYTVEEACCDVDGLPVGLHSAKGVKMVLSPAGRALFPDDV